MPEVKGYTLISIHRVKGDAQAIVYLKDVAPKDLLERIFFEAKRKGKAEFMIRKTRYEVTVNRDLGFVVRKLPEKHEQEEEVAED